MARTINYSKGYIAISNLVERAIRHLQSNKYEILLTYQVFRSGKAGPVEQQCNGTGNIRRTNARQAFKRGAVTESDHEMECVLDGPTETLLQQLINCYLSHTNIIYKIYQI